MAFLYMQLKISEDFYKTQPIVECDAHASSDVSEIFTPRKRTQIQFFPHRLELREVVFPSIQLLPLDWLFVGTSRWTGVSNKVAPECVALTFPLLVCVGSMSATSWWKFMGLNALWKMCWTWTPAQRKSSADILSSCYKTQLLKTTSMSVCRASGGDHKMGVFLWLSIWYSLLLSFR